MKDREIDNLLREVKAMTRLDEEKSTEIETVNTRLI